MKKINFGGTVKLIGATATVLGFASTLMSNWVSNKTMEDTINEKVKLAIDEYLKNNQ